ncbi:5'-nucleotidase [Archangium sp.]|uniref:5'-nucleotidase n=1 Tax=Archangium sp. TaxID=1872627 RepID=UPI002D78B44D|nr:5'-nucleotidase [Archangium sp.]
MRSVLPVLLVLLLNPLMAGAAPRKAVLLFTGDNGGEIAHCGCGQNPAGGLARRKTVLSRERAKGEPVLVLDAGNALFKSIQSGSEPSARARAELLLEQMDVFGTAAMAVGARDLVLGTDFLKTATRKTKMKLLSANLVDAKGKPLFAASTVVTVEGMRFGVVGLSPEGEVAPGVVGRPPVPAALAEARRLREKEKVDVVMVLAAVPLAAAQALSREAGEAVDFIVQSHEGRIPGTAQRNGHTTLLPAGERGRQLGRLELTLDGAGPFVDLAEAARARDGLKLLDENIQRARERLAVAKDEATRRALEESLAAFMSRRQQLADHARERPDAATRTQLLSFILLGPDVADDPELKKRVEQIEPPGSAPH